MKTCLIIYNRAELDKNRYFAESIRNELVSLGCRAEIAVAEALPAHAPELVINRTRDAALAGRFEATGARVFNSSEVCLIGNDKRIAYERLSREGVPMMKSLFFEKGEECFSNEYPCVAKPAHGHGGALVSLCEDEKALIRACAAIFAEGDTAVVQPLATKIGEDTRCYLLGGKLLAAVRRRSESDFRANFTLGAGCKAVQPGAVELELLRSVNGLLKPDFVGVDIICDEGEPVLNEIEDAVGCRMLYSLGICDAAALFADWVFHSA